MKSRKLGIMTENLKFIVQEVNNLLKTDYNLISFDSLPVESTLQVLVDIFATYDVQPKVGFFEAIFEQIHNISLISLR